VAVQTFISDTKNTTQKAFHSQILIVSTTYDPTEEPNKSLFLEDMEVFADKIYHHYDVTDADDNRITLEDYHSDIKIDQEYTRELKQIVTHASQSKHYIVKLNTPVRFAAQAYPHINICPQIGQFSNIYIPFNQRMRYRYQAIPMSTSIPHLSLANTICIIRGVAENPLGYTSDVLNCVIEHITGKLQFADPTEFFPLVTQLNHRTAPRKYLKERVIQLLYTRGSLADRNSLEFQRYHTIRS
jgi:hypothetical protein